MPEYRLRRCRRPQNAEELKRSNRPGAETPGGTYLLHYRFFSSVERKRLKDPWTFYMAEQGEVKNSKKEGVYTHYYEDGKTQSVSFYVSGFLEGDYTSYGKDGIATTTAYSHGVPAEEKLPSDL